MSSALLSCPTVDSDTTNSDHFPVIYECLLDTQPVVAANSTINVLTRHTRDIDFDFFRSDLRLYLDQMLEYHPDSSFFDYVSAFNDIANLVLENHAPLTRRTVKDTVIPGWMDREFDRARKDRRKLEKKFKRTRDPEVRIMWHTQAKLTSALADTKRTEYFSKLIAGKAGDQKALFSFVTKLLDTSSTSPFPEGPPSDVANNLNYYFVNKIQKLYTNMINNSQIEVTTHSCRVMDIDNEFGNNNTTNNIITNYSDSDSVNNNLDNTTKDKNPNTGSVCFNNNPDNTTNDIIPNSDSDSVNNNLDNTTNNINLNTDSVKDTTILSEFSPCSQSELEEIISSSRISTSDVDPLPADILKECIGDILPYLTVAVNASLEYGVMDGVKDAVIRPLLKKANLDHNNLASFRPISNIPFMSKLVERVVHKRTNEHLARNGFDCDTQFGYKKNHGTETLLLHFLDEILVAVDKNLGVVVLIIDLSAAFDTVCHSKLINILYSSYGIRGKALKWFKSFLTGRSQCVKVGSALSSPLILSFGVPQGSVLGPILFNLYTQSIYKVFKAYCFSHHGYADDNGGSRAFASSFQFEILINTLPDLISSLNSWMRDHFLKLNESKTEIIVFGSNNFKSNIHIHGTITNSGISIRFSDCIKYLGVNIDSSLNFLSHINYITSSCYTYIRKIRSVRKYLSQKDTESLVHAFISSRVDMCNSLFFGLPQVTLLKLQRLQNAAVRVIFKLRKRDPVHEHLRSLHWLNIEERITFKILLMTFKCIQGCAPVVLQNLIFFKDPSSMLLEVKFFFPRTELGRRSFRYSAPRLWNCLPLQIRLSKTVDTFKTRLKTFLFSGFADLKNQYNRYL